jgi:hypothetical protein
LAGERVHVGDVRQGGSSLRIGVLPPRGGGDPIPWVAIDMFLVVREHHFLIFLNIFFVGRVLQIGKRWKGEIEGVVDLYVESG